MLKAVRQYIKEHVENRHFILKLAYSSAKADTDKTTLGIYWNLIRDAVFFVAYSMFMTLMRRGNSTIEGIPGLVFLITGLVGWYMINDSLTTGVKCILKNKHIFTKIRFPILIIPTYETIALFIKRGITLALLAIILSVTMLATSYRVDINIFGFLYSIFAAFVFSVGYNLLMSGFYSISRDFRELYHAVVRIQFYFVPVFWSVYQDLPKLGVPEPIVTIISYTPFIHIVNSFRRSISLNDFPPLSNVLVFWAIVVIMFAVGCYVQYKLRRIYADFV